MLKGKNINQTSDIEIQDIPIIEVVDPYAYITSIKTIAILYIKGGSGMPAKRYLLLRTKNGNYIWQTSF